MEKFPLISELDDLQKGHMLHLLDSKTFCGFFNAGRIMRGEMEEYNNKPINNIFESFNLTSDRAIYLSKKVLEYSRLQMASQLLKKMNNSENRNSKKLGL